MSYFETINLQKYSYVILMMFNNISIRLVAGAFIVIIAIWTIVSCSDEKIISPTSETIYYSDIKYILDAKCATSGCHAGAEPAAELGLENYEDILAGSIHGPIVYPGRSDISMLYRTMAGISMPLMPEDKLLEKSIVDSIALWIDDGLFNSRD